MALVLPGPDVSYSTSWDTTQALTEANHPAGGLPPYTTSSDTIYKGANKFEAQLAGEERAVVCHPLVDRTRWCIVPSTNARHDKHLKEKAT